MPEATLKFSLPDEKTEFEEACVGFKYKAVLYNLDQLLRDNVKNGIDANFMYAIKESFKIDSFDSPETVVMKAGLNDDITKFIAETVLEAVREKLRELAIESCVSVD
jgi:hypothetical protein